MSKSESATSNLTNNIGKKSLYTSNHWDGKKNGKSRQPRFINFVLSNLQAQLR